MKYLYNNKSISNLLKISNIQSIYSSNLFYIQNKNFTASSSTTTIDTSNFNPIQDIINSYNNNLTTNTNTTNTFSSFLNSILELNTHSNSIHSINKASFISTLSTTNVNSDKLILKVIQVGIYLDIISDESFIEK